MDRFGNNNTYDENMLQQEQQQQQKDRSPTTSQQSPPIPAPHPIVDEEELLAAQAAADAAQQAQQPGGAFNNVGQGLTGEFRDVMMQYWQETINLIEHEEHDFKNHQLPLARIKKVMKTDEDVRMISAEAPILFAKGCDVFITELTMRAWIHAEENKRRTLQKSDIAAALTKSDMFDFLIDVVPREEEKVKKYSQTRASYQQPYQEPVQSYQEPAQTYQEPAPTYQESAPPPAPPQQTYSQPQETQETRQASYEATPQNDNEQYAETTQAPVKAEEYNEDYQQQMLHQQVGEARDNFQQFNQYSLGYNEYH